MTTSSLKAVRKLTRVPDGLIRSLRHAGHIEPSVDAHDVEHYSQGDLLVLRIVAALREAKVSSPRILQSLGAIRAGLPLDTGRAGRQVTRASVAHAATSSPGTRIDKQRQAESHFVAALELEDTDAAGARSRYLAALRVHRHHTEARINLGRLLHLDGQLQEAERIYRAAKFSHALLSFNLALLLEDMNRHDEAVQAYREALALDPGLHDVHFNLSRLHERAKRPREALFHLLAYRRHLAHKPAADAGDAVR